jgi:hypothetical protein
LRKKNANFHVICVIAIALAAAVLSSCSPDEPRLKYKILDYCETNNEITISAVTSFDWDIAYFDYEPYMQGEDMKEKYGLSGELKTLQTDDIFRIAFYKGDELVRDEILDWLYIKFDQSVETIKPDTLFSAEWTTMTYFENPERVLVLTLVN